MSNRDTNFADGDNQKGLLSRLFVRSALLAPYAEVTRAVGLEPTRMLRRAGLPIEALNQPEHRLASARVQQLIDQTAEAAEIPHFGLLVGQACTYATVGAVGLLAREQPTIRHAIGILADYAKFQNNTLELRLEDRMDALLLRPTLMHARLRADRQLGELVLAMYLQVLRGLLGASWRPSKTYLSHEAPADEQPYRELFGEVEFDVGFDGFEALDRDIDIPIPTANADLAAEIARFIERNAAARGVTMTDRVSEVIGRLLPTGGCSVDQVGLFLGVDRRTLHRKLQAEGQSFTGLVQRVRQDVVALQLADGDRSLGAIAEMLGFSSLSTFSRWFRQTYGVSAREYRFTPRT